MKVNFVIPGKPLPQQRPYVTRNGTFDRKQSKDAKLAIAVLGTGARVRSKSIVSVKPFRVILVFANPHASSDIDNLCKLVLDGLKGVFWKDDRQVTHLEAFKVKDPNYTRTLVEVEEINE